MTRTVLIVDDSQVNRSILKRILAGRYETLEAADGQAALDVVRERGESLSAILLDLIMPGMDGFSFLDSLREEQAQGRIPVIVMTGEDGEDTEVRALRCGATDFLNKPYRPQIILARLENIIQLRETAALVGRVERDRLTGLYNQEGFYEQLERRLLSDPERALVLVAMDIGNFKLVNDLYGEPAGDELLAALGRSIQNSFGETGALLARKTGDQFLFAFPEGAVDRLLLEREGRKWVRENALDLELPLRFGAYQIQGLTEPVSVMCDNAKLAADSIRGRYDVHFAVYDSSMRSQLLSDQQLADSLEESLRDGRFEAWYQPKWDPRTGKVVGAEALVRWNHPQRGPLSPDQFIPLFEKNRLITRLDRFMWERVCADLAAWQAAGRPAVPVSVNVSRVDVYDRRLPLRFQILTRKLGVDPALLPLEITESAYGDDPVQLADTVAELRRLGFPVEMDDFGSGYSSLNMLTELPLDGLKLDMKFMRNLGRDERGTKFLGHLMQMVMDLGLTITAEGVETAEQAAFLREMGCPRAQGLYYSGALPREEFEAFLLSHL